MQSEDLRKEFQGAQKKARDELKLLNATIARLTASVLSSVAPPASDLSGVLERYFVGASDIWVLDLDESLLAAELRWEAPADPRTGTARTSPTTEKFPHVYGPINCRAVVDSRLVC